MIKKTEMTAFHEAGHAVAHVALNLPFKYVTIIPTKDSKGHIAYSRPTRIVRKWNEGDRDSADIRHYFERELITTLAGLAAQRRRFPRSHAGMTYTIKNAANCFPDPTTGFCLKAGDRVALDGADYTTAGRIVYDLFANEDVALEYWVFINARTKALIHSYWDAIERVASTLIERQTLDYDDVRRLVLDIKFSRSNQPTHS